MDTVTEKLYIMDSIQDVTGANSKENEGNLLEEVKLCSSDEEAEITETLNKDKAGRNWQLGSVKKILNVVVQMNIDEAKSALKEASLLLRALVGEHKTTNTSKQKDNGSQYELDI